MQFGAFRYVLRGVGHRSCVLPRLSRASLNPWKEAGVVGWSMETKASGAD